MGHKESDMTQQLTLALGTKRCFAGEERFARLPPSDPLGSISVANAWPVPSTPNVGSGAHWPH